MGVRVRMNIAKSQSESIIYNYAIRRGSRTSFLALWRRRTLRRKFRMWRKLWRLGRKSNRCYHTLPQIIYQAFIAFSFFELCVWALGGMHFALTSLWESSRWWWLRVMWPRDLLLSLPSSLLFLSFFFLFLPAFCSPHSRLRGLFTG